MPEVSDLKQHNQKIYQEIVLNLSQHFPQLLLDLLLYIFELYLLKFLLVLLLLLLYLQWQLSRQ